MRTKTITEPKITIQKLPLIEVLDLGWRVLVEKLGVVGAARFFRALHPGKGDSVKEFEEIWRGKNLKQIHQEILRAKKNKLI